MPNTGRGKTSDKTIEKEKDSKVPASPSNISLPKNIPKNRELAEIVANFFEKNKQLKTIEKPIGQMSTDEKRIFDFNQ